MRSVKKAREQVSSPCHLCPRAAAFASGDLPGNPPPPMRPKVRPLPALPTGGRRTAKPCHNRPPGGAVERLVRPAPPLADVADHEAAAQARTGGFVVCRGLRLGAWVGALGGCLRGLMDRTLSWQLPSWLPHRFAAGSWWLIFFLIWNFEFADLHLWRLPFDSREQLIQRHFQRRRELHRRVEARQGQTALDLADRGAVRRGPEGKLVLAHVRCTASLGEVDSRSSGRTARVPGLRGVPPLHPLPEDLVEAEGRPRRQDRARRCGSSRPTPTRSRTARSIRVSLREVGRPAVTSCISSESAQVRRDRA